MIVIFPFKKMENERREKGKIIRASEGWGKDSKNGIFVIPRLNFILKIKIGRYEDILDKCI